MCTVAFFLQFLFFFLFRLSFFCTALYLSPVFGVSERHGCGWCVGLERKVGYVARGSGAIETVLCAFGADAIATTCCMARAVSVLLVC